MDITHDSSKGVFETVVEGVRAYVSYRLVDGCLDIEHTIVPPEIGGRGVAAALVKTAYDYALAQGLKPVATCEYAAVWLKRNPQYGADVATE
ncbi:MAG TPA: N-acetyltransferase [Candidatus Barnesiella excrementigallinarum]|nr:N-acetyltransferase [Candidatus Barnesiella excrementigallinarum]